MKRINFKTITIKNFLSVGDSPITIPFKRGISVITGINKDKDQKNGVGKSTIADALFFCLFGVPIRELKKEEIVNNINQKNCVVTLEFDITENETKNEYVATRSITPTKFKLQRNDENITKSSMPETTQEIIKMIGSPEVFLNSVIMTINGTVPFMLQKKVDRRKFCEGLFSLSVFSNMLLESRQRHNSLKTTTSVEESKQDEIKKSMEFYTEQKNKKDTYKKERLDKLNARAESNKKELADLETVVNVIDTKIKTDINNNIIFLQNQRNIKKELIKEIVNDIATSEASIASLKRDRDHINAHGDFCTDCNRPFTTEDKVAEANKIKDMEQKIDSFIISIGKKKVTKEETYTFVEKCDAAIEKQKTALNELNNKETQNVTTQKRIEQLNTWNTQLKDDIAQLVNDKDEFNASIKDVEDRLAAVKSRLDALKKQDDILTSVKYIVSEEGVKSFIIKKLLKILNGKLAYYITRFNAPCKFKFDEYFDEQIINERGQECSYNNFSSGEQKRIDLAILFAFMDIRRLQGNISMNLLFFDEILDTSLDDKGIATFLEIINERVEKYNEAVYIITHKGIAVKSATADVIFLEKENGFTKLGVYKDESKV